MARGEGEASIAGPKLVRSAACACALAAALSLAACGSGSSRSPSRAGLVTYRVPSESMAPTFAVGQRLLVDTRAYLVNRPAVGDVVIHYAPQGAVDPGGSHCGTTLVAPDALCPLPTGQASPVKFVKRIVAGPGDQIALINGHVVLNGRLQADRFIQPCTSGEQCTFPRPITVPPGYWFVLGDNRGQSDDSRFWGPIKTAWIVGKVVG